MLWAWSFAPCSWDDGNRGGPIGRPGTGRRESMKRDSISTAVRIALMALGSCIAVALALGPHFADQIVSGQNDFLAMYAGAKLAFTDQLYNPDAIRQVQVDSALATAEVMRFNRLPGYAMALSPIGLLPYLLAYFVWQAVNLAAVIGAVSVWPYDRPLFASVLAVCLPLYIGFANGQDVAFLIFGIAAAFRLHEGGRPGWAGFALGICLLKFHFLWAVPLVLLRNGKHRMIGGLALAGLALTVPAFLLNPAWPADYYASIVSGRDVISKVPWTLFRWIGWFGLIPAAAAAWLAAGRWPLPIAASIAIIAAVLVSPHGYVADLTLAAPLVALVWDP